VVHGVPGNDDAGKAWTLGVPGHYRAVQSSAIIACSRRWRDDGPPFLAQPSLFYPGCRAGYTRKGIDGQHVHGPNSTIPCGAAGNWKPDIDIRHTVPECMSEISHKGDPRIGSKAWLPGRTLIWRGAMLALRTST
jgi:hypothetical protein